MFIIIPWTVAALGFLVWWSIVLAAFVIVGALIVAYYIFLGIVFVFIVVGSMVYHTFKRTPKAKSITPVKAMDGPRDWKVEDN